MIRARAAVLLVLSVALTGCASWSDELASRSDGTPEHGDRTMLGGIELMFAHSQKEADDMRAKYPHADITVVPPWH